MKTLRILGKALMSVLMAMCIISCSNEISENVSIRDENSIYEVKLDLSGEYIDISETPLAKADAPKKLYAINVYCMKTDGSEDEYSHYAFGFFDNLEAMKISLLGGYKYKFICTSATEGKDRFLVEYGLEWLCVGISVINEFQTDYYEDPIDRMNSGMTEYLSASGGRTGSYYPKMDRYYGVLTDYIPSEGGVASIPMKRCAFGVSMRINGVPDGELSWSVAVNINSNNSFSFTTWSHTGDEVMDFSAVYTFADVRECWEKAIKDEEYSETFTLEYTWERSNGYKQVFSKEFTVKRNVMTNIIITLTGGSPEVKLGVEEENDEMTNEYINIDYDGSSTNNTAVSPED